jgi:hypothetical protein
LIEYLLETFLRFFVPEGMEKCDAVFEVPLHGRVAGDGKRNCADLFKRFGMVMMFLGEERARGKK